MTNLSRNSARFPDHDGAGYPRTTSLHTCILWYLPPNGFYLWPALTLIFNFARFGAGLSGPEWTEWTRVSLANANIFIVVNLCLLFLPLTRLHWSWSWSGCDCGCGCGSDYDSISCGDPSEAATANWAQSMNWWWLGIGHLIDYATVKWKKRGTKPKPSQFIWRARIVCQI